MFDNKFQYNVPDIAAITRLGLGKASSFFFQKTFISERNPFMTITLLFLDNIEVFLFLFFINLLIFSDIFDRLVHNITRNSSFACHWSGKILLVMEIIRHVECKYCGQQAFIMTQIFPQKVKKERNFFHKKFITVKRTMIDIIESINSICVVNINQ